jgi:hypothetical protein
VVKILLLSIIAKITDQLSLTLINSNSDKFAFTPKMESFILRSILPGGKNNEIKIKFGFKNRKILAKCYEKVKFSQF